VRTEATLMVKQVTAWAADDGKMFATEREAALHDARENLKALGIFNEASINAICTRADEVSAAVSSYAAIIASDPKETVNAQHG
jgi:hypothetical protein